MYLPCNQWYCLTKFLVLFGNYTCQKTTAISLKHGQGENKHSKPRLIYSVCKGAATAAKSLRSCPTLCDPIDGSPPGSAGPGILQARALEWVAISFSNAWKWKVKVKSLSCVWLFATLWTAAHQALLSMGFSRQEYWSGVPLPSPITSQESSKLFCVEKMNMELEQYWMVETEERISLCNEEHT